MHPVLDCDLARLRHAELLPQGLRGLVRHHETGQPRSFAARWSTELTALLLGRSVYVAERRAARLKHDAARLAAALADVEVRARATRARPA